MTKIFSELAIERAKVARLAEKYQKLEAEMKAALELLARRLIREGDPYYRRCPSERAKNKCSSVSWYYNSYDYLDSSKCFDCLVNDAIRQGKRNVKRRSGK